MIEVTFSFQILASEEIRCYLLWQGQRHRFYPQDLLNVLPEIFIKSNKNQHFAKSDYAKRMVNDMTGLICDDRFEQFHRAVNDKKEKDFPVQYKYKYASAC